MVKRTFAEASEDDRTAPPDHQTPRTDRPHPKIQHTCTDPSRARGPTGSGSGSLLRKPIQCALPPHREPVSFGSFEEYDGHYAAQHVNRCAECGGNFPSEHFLGLHVAENHDAFVAALRGRGDRTYACFVPPCDRVCSTPWKRRLHLIDKHHFPRTYDIYIVNDGIDRRTSILRSPIKHRSTPKKHRHGQRQGRRSRGGGLGQRRGIEARLHASANQAGKGHTKDLVDGTRCEAKSTNIESGDDEMEESSSDMDDDSESADDESTSDSESKSDEAESDEESSDAESRAKKSAVKTRKQPIKSADQLGSIHESSASPVVNTPTTSSSGSAGDEKLSRAKNDDDSDTEMASITQSMSALRFVPQAVRFGGRGRGRGRGKGGLARS